MTNLGSIAGMTAHFKQGAGLYRGVFVVLGYDRMQDSFIAGLLQGSGEWTAVGSFREGMKPEERETLAKTIVDNREADGGLRTLVRTKPGICVELGFDGLSAGDIGGMNLASAVVHLVHPAFCSFRFGEKADTCSWSRLIVDNADLLPKAGLTHPDKPLWASAGIAKEDYAAYLIRIAPRLLPFLQNRVLTSIRYPHGVPGELFYQKNCPTYAPPFVRTSESAGINYIVCDDLSTLVWLGNQAVIELHVPFQRIGEANPLEIVLDLDPPSRKEFALAVRAAIEIRQVLDRFGITGYPKVSGGKGIQIHIPLGPENTVTYDDTRVFTSFVAEYLVQKFPALFTIERLKKKRGGRLYVDYIQHAPGKTIIAPYSARGTETATVAAPLEWDEVNDGLAPEQFTIPSVLERLHTRPCPMRNYGVQSNSVLGIVIAQLKAGTTRL
ncbi:non-homologous end-joining DNA ligase [Paenibacillus sp. MY03]|uniref:non-homologous end-joining DNA ligase n=1 Tax=Paenibacillus sp. MY03 TaxID=302980 RepID=UPI00211B7180|nr:non-homologous end-joining DNA ligase [Paenibacillus sp. MY03]